MVDLVDPSRLFPLPGDFGGEGGRVLGGAGSRACHEPCRPAAQGTAWSRWAAAGGQRGGRRCWVSGRFLPAVRPMTSTGGIAATLAASGGEGISTELQHPPPPLDHLSVHREATVAWEAH